jgi:hypothetical protein
VHQESTHSDFLVGSFTAATPVPVPLQTLHVHGQVPARIPAVRTVRNG